MSGPSSRLFLVRHGQVDAAWRGRIYGDLDVPLSREGERQAMDAASLLLGEPLHSVVSSGLSRAEFGAACLRSTRPSLKRIDDAGLREMARGAWAGRFPAELEDPEAFTRWHHDPLDARPPGGESLRDLANRVLPRLDHWARVAAGGSLAIVSHCWPLRVAAATALGLSLGDVTRLDIRTGEIVALDWPVERDQNAPVLLGFALDHAPAGGAAWFRGTRPADQGPRG